MNFSKQLLTPSPSGRGLGRGDQKGFFATPTHYALFFKEEILLIALTLALSQGERGQTVRSLHNRVWNEVPC
jgi:hypothetical protein